MGQAVYGLRRQSHVKPGQNGSVDVPSAIFTPEHDELRAAVRRFVDKELAPSVDEWEAAGHFPHWVLRSCGDPGFLGVHYPEHWGGAGRALAPQILFNPELSHPRDGAGHVADLVPADY